MIRFKIDILQALKDKGVTTAEIRKKRIISESTLTDIRKSQEGGEPLKLNIKVINTLCEILHKQPGQLLEYIPDNQENKTS